MGIGERKAVAFIMFLSIMFVLGAAGFNWLMNKREERKRKIQETLNALDNGHSNDGCATSNYVGGVKS